MIAWYRYGGNGYLTRRKLVYAFSGSNLIWTHFALPKMLVADIVASLFELMFSGTTDELLRNFKK